MDQLWLKVQKAAVGAGPHQAQEPVVTGEDFPLQFPAATWSALPKDVATVWGGGWRTRQS